MGKLIKLTSLGAIVIAVYAAFRCQDSDPKVPAFYHDDHYWGSKAVKDGKFPADDMAIKRFTINVPVEVLDDLKARLSKTRYIESIKGTNFEYGFHSDQLKKVVEYWTTKFDWRQQEAALNKFDHFKTQIEGLDVHFIHAKPKKDPKVKVYPLLMVHGWPGSVVEFLKIIPMLTTPVDGVAFEVVTPSIPGYGWSEASQKPGLNVLHAARMFKKLMKRLGHEKFYYQGGDWGAIIGKALVAAFPENALGAHVSMLLVKQDLTTSLKGMAGAYFPALIYENPEVEGKMLSPFLPLVYRLLRESGYLHIQATKPDTVGAGLNDSPAGLAAYILEKFSTWTDDNYKDLPDGGLTKKFTMDELLTNIMVYWVTNSITSSQRFYKENMSHHLQAEVKLDAIEVPSVPFGVVVFPNEINNVPRALLKGYYGNITQYSIMPRGGHFSAFEEPKLLSDDFRSFVKTTL